LFIDSISIDVTPGKTLIVLEKFPSVLTETSF